MFEQFLEAELAGLRRFANAVCADHATAEDVLAESIAVAWNRWNRIEHKASALAYVQRIIVNTHSSHRRVVVRRRTSPASHQPGAFDLPGADSMDVIDDRDHLERTLREFPADVRVPLVLRYYLEMSDVEAAALLSISVPTYQSRVSRARARVRAAQRHHDETEALR